VNFCIINLAPGDPVTVTEISSEGNATRQEAGSVAFGSDDRYLQFREYYGLTLPIVFNLWPQMSQESVNETLWSIVNHKESPKNEQEIPFKEWDRMRIDFGDRARFIMPKLLTIVEDPAFSSDYREMAVRFFVRGGTRQAFLGPDISTEEKVYNKKMSKDNNYLRDLIPLASDNALETDQKYKDLRKWYQANKQLYDFEPDFRQKVSIFFTQTRLFRYLSRVLTLDFGTLRNDDNRTVIGEVTKRFKYSLTLSILPMLITFVLCQIVGFTMALKQNGWQDYSLNFICLVFYAIPIFVVAPFLIEKIALNGHFPFTNIPFPLSGFTSPDRQYDQMLSYQRLLDTLRHIFLPIVAIIYGTLAAESRLSRTAVLEVMRQDYVRTARAKGVGRAAILYKHIGRNAAITIVTSLTGSLGIILGGSLIVETLFEIDGFGKFFYDGIINRDYNVIMFSALASSFLTLIGYLAADIGYTILDPRVTLD